MLIRSTDTAQFVGGDTAEDCLPLLRRLRAENMGALFAYSVEAPDPSIHGRTDSLPSQTSSHKDIVAEMLHCIDVAADFEEGSSSADVTVAPEVRRTWVAVKIVNSSPIRRLLLLMPFLIG